MHTRGVAAVAALLFAAASCGKPASDHKSKTTTPTGAPIELGSVPASATVVLGANVKALVRSRLVTRAAAQMFERDPALKKRLDRLRADCAFDPAKDLDRVVIGLGTGPDDVVLIASGHFDPARVGDCLNRALGGGGGNVTVKSTGPHKLYRADTGTHVVWVAVGTNGTLALSRPETFLDDALGSGPKVTESAEMKPVLARANRQAPLWAAGLVPERVGKGLVQATGGQVAAPPHAAYGQLDPENGIHAVLGVVMADQMDAKAAASKAVLELALGAMVAQRLGLGPIVAKIQAQAQGAVLAMSLDLTIDELNQLLQAWPGGTPPTAPGRDAGAAASASGP